MFCWVTSNTCKWIWFVSMVSGIERRENDVIRGGVNSLLHQQVNTKVNGPHCTVQTHTQKNNRNKASEYNYTSKSTSTPITDICIQKEAAMKTECWCMRETKWNIEDYRTEHKQTDKPNSVKHKHKTHKAAKTVYANYIHSWVKQWHEESTYFLWNRFLKE